MKKVLNFIKNNILEQYIIINILYLTYMGFLFATKKIPSFEPYSLNLRLLLLVNIIAIIVINIRKYSFHKVDIALILITIFLCISAHFAYNNTIALYGNYSRYEGLYVLLYYLTIFYLSTYSKNKKLIIYTILFVGFIQFFYSICYYNKLLGLHPKNPKWVTGFVTNPNFYGGYMLMCLSLSMGLYIEQKNKILNILLLILSCCFVISLILSNTMSSLVAFIIVSIILLIYCIKNKKLIKYTIIILSVISVFFVMNKKGNTTLSKDFAQTQKEAINITKGKVSESYGTSRIYIWKRAIKHVPKYLIHGIGIDNFRYIDNGEPIKKKSGKITTIFDKAHNDYLQILLTSGIFCLLSYIAFYIIIIISGIKNKLIYLLLPIIGYLVHLMFSISVVEVSPIFYICAGLIIERKEKKEKYVRRFLDKLPFINKKYDIIK